MPVAVVAESGDGPVGRGDPGAVAARVVLLLPGVPGGIGQAHGQAALVVLGVHLAAVWTGDGGQVAPRVVPVPGDPAQWVGAGGDPSARVVLPAGRVPEGVGDRGDPGTAAEPVGGNRPGDVRPGGDAGIGVITVRARECLAGALAAHATALIVVAVPVEVTIAVLPSGQPGRLVVTEPQRLAGGVDDAGQVPVLVVAVADQRRLPAVPPVLPVPPVPAVPARHAVPAVPARHAVPAVPARHAVPAVPARHAVPAVPARHGVPAVPARHAARLAEGQAGHPAVRDVHPDEIAAGMTDPGRRPGPVVAEADLVPGPVSHRHQRQLALTARRRSNPGAARTATPGRAAGRSPSRPRPVHAVAATAPRSPAAPPVSRPRPGRRRGPRQPHRPGQPR